MAREKGEVNEYDAVAEKIESECFLKVYQISKLFNCKQRHVNRGRAL